MSFDVNALLKNNDAPVIDINGLRYVWVDNVTLSGEDKFDLIGGVLSVMIWPIYS